MPKRMRASALSDIPGQFARARKTQGLTQAVVAQRLGIPQSHLSRIEAGKVDIRLSSLIDLARLLQLEPVLVHRSALPAVKKIVEHFGDADVEQTPWLYRLGE